MVLQDQENNLINYFRWFVISNISDVVYEGKSLFERHTNKAHLRLNDIGFIFQASHLVPYLKVLDQLTLIGKETGMSSKEAQARAKELLTKLD